MERNTGKKKLKVMRSKSKEWRTKKMHGGHRCPRAALLAYACLCSIMLVFSRLFASLGFCVYVYVSVSERQEAPARANGKVSLRCCIRAKSNAVVADRSKACNCFTRTKSLAARRRRRRGRRSTAVSPLLASPRASETPGQRD